MPMTHVPEIGAENRQPARKPVSVSGTSHMQFSTEFFWYPFSGTYSVLISGMCVMGITTGGAGSVLSRYGSVWVCLLVVR